MILWVHVRFWTEHNHWKDFPSSFMNLLLSMKTCFITCFSSPEWPLKNLFYMNFCVHCYKIFNSLNKGGCTFSVSKAWLIQFLSIFIHVILISKKLSTYVLISSCKMSSASSANVLFSIIRDSNSWILMAHLSTSPNVMFEILNSPPPEKPESEEKVGFRNFHFWRMKTIRFSQRECKIINCVGNKHCSMEYY